MNEQPIRVLDLFSGIGGFALAAEIANAMVNTEIRSGGQFKAEQQGRDSAWGSGAPRFIGLAHAEVEPFACAVYHKHFPDSVCFGGIENVSRDSLLERTGFLPDVVCGGWPCQGNSCAGKRKGMQDERSGLWNELIRVVSELRPRFCLFENVAGVLTVNAGRDFGQCLSDLASLRYACQWQVVPASAVGAPHRRDRIWMLCWDELANPIEQRGCGWNSQRKNADHVKPSSARPLSWPALSGHWPSRPGEPQHGWEYPRVAYSKVSKRRGNVGADNTGRGLEEAGRPDGGEAGRQTLRGLGTIVDGFSEWMDRSSK